MAIILKMDAMIALDNVSLFIFTLGHVDPDDTYREPKEKTNVNALFWLLDIIRL